MEQKFKLLIADKHRLIYEVCRMYCSNESDIREVYQDVLIQLRQLLPSFKRESYRSTWIYRIANNASNARFRKGKRKPMYEDFRKLIAETLRNPNPPKEGFEQLYRAIALLARKGRHLSAQKNGCTRA